MKVILNAEKVENEFYLRQNPKKRGNLLKINKSREYVVKEIATDSYGTFFKLAGIQKPFDTKWFYVSEVSPNESVYAKADVYAAAEYGITADSIVEEGRGDDILLSPPCFVFCYKGKIEVFSK